MSPDTALAPSPKLASARLTAQRAWNSWSPPVRDGLSSAALQMADEMMSALAGVDPAQAGWGVFALGAYLMGDAARIEPYIRPKLSAEFVDYLEGAALLVCRVGECLVTRDDERHSHADQSAAARCADPRLARIRTEVVPAASANFDWLTRSREHADEIRDRIRSSGTGQDDGFLSDLATHICGLDTEQAGWGLLTCGTLLLALAADLAPDSLPWWRRVVRTKQVGTWVARAFAGSILIVAGDTWIEATPNPGSPA